MKNILEELYFGSIDKNFELYGNNPDYVESAQLKEINHEKLVAALNESEKERFEKYLVADRDLKEIEQYNTFTYAFKLGVLLMTEVVALHSTD
ncbi:MAG: hypothetical protein FWE20_01265 [Defluviitaleaceae bacterium]|nr:hypothetical protein [Defluviitaleaceae bacterium]